MAGFGIGSENNITISGYPNIEPVDLAAQHLRLDETEAEVAKLETIIKSFDNPKDDSGKGISTECGGDAQASFYTTQGKIEIEKLRYRLQIMKRALEMEESREVDYMKNITTMLGCFFKMALMKAYPKEAGIPLAIVPNGNPKFGDYQCNVAMGISKRIQVSGQEVAKKIMEAFPVDNGIVESMSVAGPGFINIIITPSYVEKEVKSLFLNGVKLCPLVKRKRVVVDFSSPNVAKEMHVGHLRSTVLGDSVSRLLEFVGHDVLRLNHIGDWGTQFGMLIAHLQDEFPNYLEKEDFVLPVNDLQEFYKESKRRFDEDEAFKKRAYASVVSLQAREPSYIKAWKSICDVSRKEFSKLYERLGVVIEERGESFYQDLMKSLIEDLESRELLELEEGRKLLFPKDRKQIPLTIVKSDGGFTYDTSDLAAIKHRIEVEKGDWIIYITDAGQATHFHSIFQCAEKAEILDVSKVRIDHLGFGVVLGEDRKKFKTRSGDTVRLADLLNEGIRRAGEKLKEKGRDKELTEEEFLNAQTSVAYGCIKYADLVNNRNKEYVFSFDKMLDDKGNTAVYLLYAYTRISSIARKAEVTPEALRDYVKNNEPKFLHEKELKLGKKLLKFPEVLERITGELMMHSLCELIYDICTTFTEFYDSCYCIEKDGTGKIIKVNMDRLVLCEATALILKKGFDILGLKPVSKM